MGELCGINVDLLQHYGSQKVVKWLLEVIGDDKQMQMGHQGRYVRFL